MNTPSGTWHYRTSASSVTLLALSERLNLVLTQAWLAATWEDSNSEYSIPLYVQLFERGISPEP